MLNVLYNTNRLEFLKCIKIKQNNNVFLIKDNCGEIDLYGVKYRKNIAKK